MKKIIKTLSAFLFIFGVVATLNGCAKPKSNLVIIKEQDDSMINTYTMIAVNPDTTFATDVTRNKSTINTVGADALINWILSDSTLNLIKDYGYKDYKEYLFYIKDGHPTSTTAVPKATEATKTIDLSTTTSVNDSGLLGYLLPIFEKDYGYEVKVYSAGTGKAITNAKCGNADLIFVHSKSQEEAFVNSGYARIVEGYTSERLTFMYNYFVLVGPSQDPAKAKDCATVKDSFKAISDTKSKFISRGDESGTHTKEISLWPSELGITVKADSVKSYEWYVHANTGMGACLKMAEEQNAYILSDKATYLTYKANFGK